MFGLMRAKTCGMTPEEKHFRRLNYCGTCKTLGASFSRKSRLLLNHDAVFLAEFLTSLSGEDVARWADSYQSFNCLNLPKEKAPLSLEFAATVNIVLTKFKLADHAEDTSRKRFHFAGKLFARDFQKASEKLKKWRFPLKKIEEILSAQKDLETEIHESNAAPEEILQALAAPTALATAAFFSAGVKLVGKTGLENSASEIGFAFGKLIYFLDAFEDFEKDFAGDEFNAFRAAFDLKEKKIPPEARRKITSILRALERETIAKIYELPVGERQKNLFAARLSENLQKKLRAGLPVLRQKKVCTPKSKLSFAERRRRAFSAARRFARDYSWQMPVVFIFIFVFALIAPAQASGAKSARECFDLSFNLMFLGAIFGSGLTHSPLKMVAINHNRRKKQEDAQNEDSGSWCNWCDGCGCCCDGCDCCGNCDGCDGCGCCDCSCD